MGELARYFNAELKLGARLHVVPAAGWRRDDVVRPDRAAVGSAVAESAHARERDGLSGARALRGLQPECRAGDDGRLPGVRCAVASGRRRGRRTQRARACRASGSSAPTSTPRAAGDGKYSGKTIPGVRIVVTDRNRFSPAGPRAAILWAVQRAAPDSLVVRGAVFDDRFGRPAMREAHHARRGPRSGRRRATAPPSRRGGARWRDTSSIDNLCRAGPRMCLAPTVPRHQSFQPDREPNP